MSYKKILVDNPICNRRFHITFDDEGAPEEQVELICPHCQVVIFKEKNHPECKIAREENLTKTTNLVENIARECKFHDNFSPAPKPM